jgi:DNA-binding transcriptional regulator YbjK
VSKPAHNRSHVPQLLFSLVLLTLAVLILLFRQDIIDKYHVMNYTPSAEMQAVTQRSGFSDVGTYLFFASRPLLQDRTSFNDSCRSVATEQTAILGCYAAQRIYLFDIDDPRLDGVKEVTAAHEMLHAVYDRMSFDEKKDINALLEAQSQALGNDQGRVDELLAQYAETEPGERLNELHSILGSEIATLSPELEEYYAQYFTDRAGLVSLAQKYQSVFNELQQQQDTLVNELNALADAVDAQSAAYRRNLQVLEGDIAAFNRRANSGTLTREEYDRERTALLLRQNILRQEYGEIQELIRSYERKRAELAAINSESNALNRSINSSLDAEPSESL